MAKIHVNPTTGEPGECRAKKRCRFGADTPHYETVEEALNHFAQQQGLDEIPQSVSKISYGAKTLLEYGKAIAISQEKFRDFRSLEKDDPKRLLLKDEYEKLYAINNEVGKRLSKMEWDDTDAPYFNLNETIEPPSQPDFVDEDNSFRPGYANDWIKVKEKEKKLYDFLDKAGEVWIKRLSTAEVKAVLRYNRGADEYAKTVKSSSEDLTNDEAKYLKYLHSAVSKAPRTKISFRAFAGISQQRVKDVIQEAEKGSLNLDRVQSASLNPAIINSFMRSENLLKEKDDTVVEFETTHIASLSAFHQNRLEMELLIPPGKFKVEKKLQEISYYWNYDETSIKNPVGRTSVNTYIVSENENKE